MARTPGKTPPLRANGAATEEEIVDKNDLEVVVDDDTEVNQEQQAPVVEETVEALKAQLDEERRRREAAEANARSATQQVENSAERMMATQMSAIANAIDKEEAAKRELRAKVRAAKEAGDYDAETDALDQLQQTNLKIARLNEGKTELERRIEEVKEIPADPVERFTANMAAPAKAWVMAHSEYVTDDAKRAELEAAHFMAKGRRLREGSPEYFADIEATLGLRDGGVMEPQQREPSKRPPAAPPSRDTSAATFASADLPRGVTMDGSGRYRLSPELREYARISGLSDKDYLKSLLDIHKENRSTH